MTPPSIPPGGLETAWGARLVSGGARFRLWAPADEVLTLRLNGQDHPMKRAEGGWFEATVEGAEAGDAYLFVLPDGTAVPDPAARAQEEGVHGPSVLVDHAYPWRHASPARPWEEAVIYELHIGTFTREGTFAAAAAKLPHLVSLGITGINVMPVAQFEGNRGWGYDGVLLYAPHPAYGTPDDMRAFVDAAHGAGLMVMLDVVYNHFGPEGNYLGAYAPAFFHDERQTPWGNAIAYEKEPVRRFFIDNALAWLHDYDLDGLRFDAIDHIRDQSDTDIMVEMARDIRALRGGRPTWLHTEDARNITRLHERAEDGSAPLYDGEWNDDMHNALHVCATGETDGYYADFGADRWELLARSLAEGFAFQGEQQLNGEPRGHPSAHLPPTAFVDFVQNHDQVGNRANGDRLCALIPPAEAQEFMAILLLSPHIPLLFMGEEWGETRPFLFFTDFHGELAQAVREGRRREFEDFPNFEDEAALGAIPDPNDPETFRISTLDWTVPQQDMHFATLELTRRLLRLRKEHVTPRLRRTGGNAGRVVDVEREMIAVDWHLDGATWALRANFSRESRPMPRAEGALIYGPARGVAGELPGFTVSFHLAEDA